MSRVKIVEHRSGIQEIVNPVALRARELRERAYILDVETTGLTVADEVIEIGIVRASTGKVLMDRQFRPSKKIEPFAQQVHGIHDSELADKPRIGDAEAEIFSLLDGATVGAWNAAYDSRMLGQTFRLYGLREPRVEWVCVMNLYKQFKGLPAVCSLARACEALRVKQGSHRAVSDALAAARVLYRMADAEAGSEIIERNYGDDGDDDADGVTMTAREFLTQCGWQERRVAIGGRMGVVSLWTDPESGMEFDFLTAMDAQRERMRGADNGRTDEN